MWFVYVLWSIKDGNLYIGCTANLQNRIESHNKDYIKSTKCRRPLKLVFSESYSDKFEAFKIDRYYKSAKGKKEIKSKFL